MKLIRTILCLFIIISCDNKKKIDDIVVSENKSHVQECVFDSINIYGVMVSYKFHQIHSDSIVYDFKYKIYKDSLLSIDNVDCYITEIKLINRISNVFFEEKPKSYDDYDPLPEAVYPSINAVFYKDYSIYEEKDFLIVNDTLEYSNDFYKAVDFLYILQIKNVQNEDIGEFVKNYKWELRYAKSPDFEPQ